ncbi:heterokaryon incompatibility protein-domain-containing protein [Paraphoma chrysanthemicola]|nr:heterokaryon incompatibility protein-domain-containing protein [Paraphoma chrysanthemicola]
MIADDRQLDLIISDKEIWIFDYEFVVGSEGHEKGHYSISGRRGYSPPWPHLKLAAVGNDSLGSDRCFAKIRSWICTCEREHKHGDCSKPARSPLPDRVIALDVKSDAISLKLLTTNGESEKYLALSHRWGSSPLITTTTKNLTAMSENIDLAALPRTFTDAVLCAKNLGVRYLWIDSLCIVQDDMTDWQRQSAKMESYYSGAYLVVAAASADGSNVGFLKERPPIYTGIPFETVSGSGILDMVVRRIMPHRTGSRLTASVAMEHDYIDSRAWCMQETILARRTVFFHNSELLWQCQSTTDCECGRSMKTSPEDEIGPDHFSSYTASPGIREFLTECSGILRYSGRPLSTLNSIRSVYIEWRHGIVPLYTEKDITHTTDRLPALSGLAAKVHQYLESQHHPDQYLAGIWRSDPLGLLWAVERHHDPENIWEPDEYLGPSFSWVSVNHSVCYKIPPAMQSDQYPPVYGDIKCSIKEAHITIDGLNPFGAVTDGFIKVSGLACSMTIRIGTSAEERYWLDCGAGSNLTDFWVDTHLAPVKIRKKKGYTLSLNRFGKRTFDERYKGSTPQIHVDGLVVASLDPEPGEYGDWVRYAILVLGKSVLRSGMYQRLGVAGVGIKSANTQPWLDRLSAREFTII